MSPIQKDKELMSYSELVYNQTIQRQSDISAVRNPTFLPRHIHWAGTGSHVLCEIQDSLA